MPSNNLLDQPHRRFNPLTQEWILVSPHRTRRPWLGLNESEVKNVVPIYDPECYMCPGNARATGTRNPEYQQTFVFDNDYPALLPDAIEKTKNDRALIVAERETGICRVLCFSPRHDLSLSTIQPDGVHHVVEAWTRQSEELGALPAINYVQIFENRGAMMGASNPHPHSQIWASSSVPNEPMKELQAQRQYKDNNGTCLLCDYLSLEHEHSQRFVFENAHFAVLVPFWAIWPFETILISKRHFPSLTNLTQHERTSLAETLQGLSARYDRLFNIPFPYSMGFHQCPTDGEPHAEWHIHAHFYPPLLRSATVRKFMVGYEMLGTPQRDITAETAAGRLREL